MKTTLQNAVFWLLSVLMVVFGLNKFLGFIPVQPTSDPIAQQFLGTMFSSYLFVVVALFEIFGGILLTLKKTRFFGWMILAPVMFNIVAFHVSHDFVGNGIWLLPSSLFLVAGYLMKGENFQFLKF